jgi:GT2 family glycosyltransferase
MQKAIQQGATYHLVLNPDIEFSEGTLEKLVGFMDDHLNVGLVQPKILYPNGNIQYLCKLLPTPFDLIFRRFLPSLCLNSERTKRYELHNMDYSSVHFDIPTLSGCFLFFRADTLKQAGLFDERFFLYMEDVDLSRRIQDVAQTAFYPLVTIVHTYEKGSYKNYKLLWYHLVSAFKYFNKWGWFFDRSKAKINSKINTLNC